MRRFIAWILCLPTFAPNRDKPNRNGPDRVDADSIATTTKLSEPLARLGGPADRLPAVCAQPASIALPGRRRRPRHATAADRSERRPALASMGAGSGAGVAASIDVAPARAAAVSRPARARPSWISFDPTDLRRTVIAGTFGEVCAVLDQLAAIQERMGASAPR